MQDEFDAMEEQFNKSTESAFRNRANEYEEYRFQYSGGNEIEKKVSALYNLLRTKCLHVANYYHELLFPIPGVKTIHLDLTMVFENMADLHFELAHLHEKLKQQYGVEQLRHPHLEVFHRTMAQGTKENAKLFGGKHPKSTEEN